MATLALDHMICDSISSIMLDRWTRGEMDCEKVENAPTYFLFMLVASRHIHLRRFSPSRTPLFLSVASLSHTHGSGGCRRGQRIGRRGGQPASGAPRAASGIHGGPPVGHPVRAAAGHPWRPAAETTVSRIQQYAVPVFMDGAWDGE
jgi:hypothetical protein